MQLFKTGVQSTARYGAAATGFSPREISNLRKTAARFSPYRCKKADNNFWWGICPKHDPLHLAVGSLQRYCKEWWATTLRVPGNHVHQDTLSPSQLWGAFDAALQTFD
eukprot:3860009-Pyramimonas_sp.AAC.1